jgi:hypothetical protein
MFKKLKTLFWDERGTTLTFTYSFSPNTLIVSSQVNQNFTDVAAVVNALTADNLADDAVTAVKLNADVVRSGYGLIQHSDGSLYVDVSDTNPCLEIADGGLRLKVDGVTLERASGGVQCVATKVAFLDTIQTFTNAKTFTAPCDFLSVETDTITLNGALVNAANGLLKLDTSGYVPAAQFKTYDSGWFAITTSQTYTKTHNLGTTKCLITIMISDNSDGSGYCNFMNYDGNALHNGEILRSLSTTEIKIQTASSQIFSFEGANYGSGYARIIMMPLA